MVHRARTLRASLCASTALQAAALVVLASPAAGQVAPGVRPTGGQVSSGLASIGGNASTTTINQTSQNAVINWQTYNVGSQQTIRYTQPNAASFALNRVITAQPSQIAGHIVANGRIAIVNQSGVVFLNGSTVDTAGLVVSAAGISDQDFMAGRLVFGAPARPGASISNAGNITIRQAGLAALVAPQVANSGVITAQLGRVILGGATTHTLDMYGDGLVALNVTGQVTQVQVGGKSVPALVTNTGTILAPGGTVVLTAQAADGVVSTAVSAGGTISAPTLGTQAGRVLVSGIGGDVEVDGSVSASGAGTGGAGGQVEVNANRSVTLASGSLVDVSGDTGGGLAAIGTTAAHATNPAAPAALTAANATVRAGAAIRADGGRAGHGGTIAVASAGHTSVSGSITASGGATAGDGGVVSVEGATNFVNAAISAQAPNGIVGQITLNNLLGTAYIGNALPLGILPTDPCILGSCYSLSGITGYSKILNAHGDIDFVYNSGASNLLQDPTYTLNVQTTGAGHSINFDAGVRIDVDKITLKSAGGIFLNTSNYTLFNLPSFHKPAVATTLTAQTSIDLDAAGAISAGTGTGFGGVAGALVTPLLAITQAASVDLDSKNDLVTALGGAVANAGNFTFTDAKGLSVTSPVSATGDVFISVTGAGNALTSTAAIAGADISLQSGTGMTIGGALTASTHGTVALAALSGDLALTGAVTAGTLAASTTGDFSATSRSNAIATIGSSVMDIMTSGIEAGGTVSLMDAISLEVAKAIRAGMAEVAGRENLSLTVGTSTAAPLTLTVDAGATLGSAGGTIALQADRFALEGTSDAAGGVLAIDLYDTGALQLGSGAAGSIDTFTGHGLGTVNAGTVALGSTTGTGFGKTSSLLLDANATVSGTLGLFSTGTISEKSTVGLAAPALYGEAAGDVNLVGTGNAFGEIVSVSTGAAPLGLTSTNGSLALFDSETLNLQSTSVTATTVSITAKGGGLTQTGGMLAATSGALTVTASDFSQKDTATATAKGEAAIHGGVDQSGSALSGSSVTVDGGVTQSGASSVSGGAVTIGGSVDQSGTSLIKATGGDVEIGSTGAANTLAQSDSTISATGDVLVMLAGDLTQDAASLIATTGASNRISLASSGGTLSIGGTLSANRQQGLVSLQATSGDISEALAGESQTGTILAGTLAAEAGVPGSASAALHSVLLDTASSATSGNRIATLSGLVSGGEMVSGATGTFSLNDGSGLTIARGALVVASNTAPGAATAGVVALQSAGGIVNSGTLQGGSRDSTTGIFAGNVLLNAQAGSITESGGAIEAGRLAAAASGSIDLSTTSTLSPSHFLGNQIAEIADLTTTFAMPETIHGLSATGTIMLVDGQNLAIDAQVSALQPPETTGVISLDITSGTLVSGIALPTSPTLTIGAGGEIVLETSSPVFQGRVSLIADHYDFSAAGPVAVSAPGAIVSLDLAQGQFSDIISPGTFVVSGDTGATISAADLEAITTYASSGGQAGTPLWGTLALGSGNGITAGNTGSLLIATGLDLTQTHQVARDLGLFSTGDITSTAGIILDNTASGEGAVGGTLYGSAGSAVPSGHGFASVTGANKITVLSTFTTLGDQTPGTDTTGFTLTDDVSLLVGGPVNGLFTSSLKRPEAFNGDVSITLNGDATTLSIGNGASVNGNNVSLINAGTSGAATAIDVGPNSIVTAWGRISAAGTLGGALSLTALQGDIDIAGLLQTEAQSAMVGSTDLLSALGNTVEIGAGTILTGTLAARAGAFEGGALFSVLLDNATSNRIGTLAGLDIEHGSLTSSATDTFSVIDGSGLAIASGALVEAGNSAGVAGHAGTLSLTAATAQAGDLAVDGLLQAGTLASSAPRVAQYVGSMILDDVAGSITEASTGAVRAYALNVNAPADEVLLEAPTALQAEPLNVVEHIVGSNAAAGRFDLFDSALIQGGIGLANTTLPMQNVFVDAGAAIRGAAIDIKVADGNLNLESATGLPGAVIAGGSTVSLAADLGVLQFGGAVSGNEIQIDAGAEFAQFAGASITGLPLSLVGAIEAPTIDITAGTLYSAAGFADDIILAAGHTITLYGIALGGSVSALATGEVGSVTLSTPAGDISQAAPNNSTTGAPTTAAPPATGTITAGNLAFQAGQSSTGGTLSNVWLTASGNRIGTITGIGGVSQAAGALSVTDAMDLALARDLSVDATGPVTFSLAGHTLTQLGSSTLASAGAITLDAALVVQTGLGAIESGDGTAGGTGTADITVTGSLSQAGQSTLTALSGSTGIGGALTQAESGVYASNDVTVGGSVVQSGSTLTAQSGSFSVGTSLAQTASVAQAGGLAILLGGGSLAQSAGSILSGGSGVDLTLAGGLTQDAASLIGSTAGGIGIHASSGDIAFEGTIRAGGTGAVTLQAGSGAIDSSAGTIDAVTLAASATGSLLLGGPNTIETIAPSSTFDGTVLSGLSSGDAITLRDAVSLAVSGATVGGATVDIATIGDLLVMGGSMTARSGNLLLSGASMTLGGAAIIEGQTGIGLSSPGAVVEEGGSSLASEAGAVALTQSGSFQQSGATIAGQTGVTLQSSGAVLQDAGSSIASAGGAVALTGLSSFTQNERSSIQGLTEIALSFSGAISQDATSRITSSDPAIGTAKSGEVLLDTPATISLAGALAGSRIVLGGNSAPDQILWSGTSFETGGDTQGESIASLIPISGMAKGLYVSTGALTVNGRTTVNGTSGAPSTVQIALANGTGSLDFGGTASGGGLYAPQAQLLLGLGAAGTASGNIDVAGLNVYYSGTAPLGGTQDLTGTVDGRTGSAAAATAFIHASQASNYQLNGCPIQSFNCVLLSPILVPPGSPVLALEVSVVHRRDDDDDLILPNVAEQDY